MEELTNKRNKLLIAVIIMAVIALGLGITYAWLTQTVNGSKVQTMRVGTFKFTLAEKNSLSVSSAEFMSDTTGLSQDGLKFTVSNTGQFTGSYSIYLDDDTLSSGQSRLSDSFVRYSLETNGTKGAATNLTSRKIYDGSLKRGETANFVLRAWLNPSVNGDIGGKVFKAKLRIEVSQS